ncbi:MAG: eukaryotic-like serine/threonine-protein kinase [Blastocatellia bacterium]|nr:eukaryotic-like serine/threonine-protein kinase [Blastocatellia bacterium]
MTLKDQPETGPTADDDIPKVSADLSAPTIPVDRPDDPSTLNETALPPASLIGVTLDGRYSVQKELGQGGVGAVYLARDRKLHDKRVVIKVLLEKSLQNSWVVQKFQQEKEALARVDHPGVVGILDNGELPDGKPYLVMQFIDGVTLRSLIRPEGIPLERAAELIKQIGRALAAAHDKGIFHRDLKPENIMLQSYGGGEEQLKIIDFGIAKLKDSIVAPSTVTGATAGTVSYMAPEQLSGRPVSAAMDIYAMGAIAYELVTGRKPFNPETGFELLEMQRAGVRVKPSDLRPSLPDDACQLILRALSFDPKDRFQNARELGDALARELAEETATFEPNRVDPTPIPATQLATDANEPARQTADLSAKTIAARFEPAKVDTLGAAVYTPVETRSAPRPWLKAVAGLVVLVVIAGASWFIWKRGAVSSAREQSLAYSLTVQKMRDGKPYQGEFESSGQEIFENGWKFRMNLSSPSEGYLYLLNEGPADGDEVTYNMLFPETKTNNGSPRVTADQKLQTAWMRFDDHLGTERFWIVYSPTAVKELDAVTDKVNDRDQGAIKDPAQARALRDFLQKHSSPKPEVTKDSAKKQTTVKAKADVLVNYVELEHH